MKLQFAEWNSIDGEPHGNNWWRDSKQNAIGLRYCGTEEEPKWMVAFYGYPIEYLWKLYKITYAVETTLSFTNLEEGKQHIDDFLVKCEKLIAFL